MKRNSSIVSSASRKMILTMTGSYTPFIFYIFLTTQQLFISLLRGKILLLSNHNFSELHKAIQSVKATAFV